jgi:hypothetical protein
MMIRDLKKRPHKTFVRYGKGEQHGSFFPENGNWDDAGEVGTALEDWSGNNYPLIKGNGKGTGTKITLAPRPGRKPLDINGRRTGSKTISLLHELFHAWQISYGKLNLNSKDGVRNYERDAVNWENVFRKELGKTSRKEYPSVTDEFRNLFNADFMESAKLSKPTN